MQPIVMPAVIAFSTFSTRISRSTELARASRSSARERWRLWRGSFVSEPRDFSTSPRRVEDGAGVSRDRLCGDGQRDPLLGLIRYFSPVAILEYTAISSGRNASASEISLV